jgi:hypothetical protein
MLIELEDVYLVVDRRGRIILETQDRDIAELCESRLAGQEQREPQIKGDC